MDGVELQRRRQASGLSQSQLAERLGVHVRTISKWERGVNPVPAVIDLALSALECERRASRAGAGSAGEGK